MFIMEIIKIKEQSINAEESKLYKKILDSLGYETEKIKKDILRVRNVGKHTLTLVVEAFRKFGYELN